MGRFIAALFALVLLLAAVVVLAPNLIPAETYKARLEAAASNALGRDVTMGEDLSFKIFPQPAFSVSDLVIANAAGFEGDHLARVSRADIGVELSPLFKGAVEISRFILTAPDLNLQKAADGSVNWNLARASNDAAGGKGPVRDINIGDMKLIGGRAIYNDAASGKTYTAEDIDATARLTSLSEPLEVQGAMRFQGAPTTFSVVLATLADLTAKKRSNLKLDAKINEATIGADLALAEGEAFAYSGPVSFDAPDLAALAALFDVALEDAPGFDRLNISGEAAGAATSVALSNAKIVFDAIDADGDIELDWAGPRPRATGALAVGTLDLRPYMPPPTKSTEGFPAWSTETINFSSLRNLDADLDISAEKVFLNEIETGPSRLNLKINGGQMTASIPQLGFYGGGGSGTLVVDARKATPSIAGKFSMNSVEAQPFTMDLMKMDKLLGLGGFTMEFSATGASQSAIMNSLNGKGGFDLNDGAIKGVNIVKLASAVGKLYEGGLSNPAAVTNALAEARRPDEKTDFSKFLSNFTIVNGDVQAPTITLEGPFLTMTGAGRVNLPGQSIDLRLMPKASAEFDKETTRTIAIPLRVGGTFSKPTMSIDMEALLRGRAEESLKGLLNKALAPKGDAAGDGAQGAEPDPAQELLRGILGGGKSAPATPADSGGADNSGGAGKGDDGVTGTNATSTNAAAEKTGPAADPAETLIREGLGALFGKKKAAEPEPAEDDGAQ
ncbi:MAG: AsmA family protein [Parvularculaceae bacterium]|nr:AsmA family protein [Parvularculaceae bacterium]